MKTERDEGKMKKKKETEQIRAREDQRLTKPMNL